MVGGYMVSMWCPEWAEIRAKEWEKGRIPLKRKGFQVWCALPRNPLLRLMRPLLCPCKPISCGGMGLPWWMTGGIDVSIVDLEKGK